MQTSDMFCWGVVRSIDERFAGCVDCSIEINLSSILIVFASRDGVIIEEIVFNVHATLSIKDWGKVDKLVNGSIVSHSHDGLELLDVSSINWKGIVLHIMDSQKYSFFMNMV